MTDETNKPTLSLVDGEKGAPSTDESKLPEPLYYSITYRRFLGEDQPLDIATQSTVGYLVHMGTYLIVCDDPYPKSGVIMPKLCIAHNDIIEVTSQTTQG